MPKRLRVGVIGTGSMGQHHCRLYATLPDVSFIGISDTSAKRGGQIASSFGVRYFPDYRKLIKEVDAVTIATPTSSHKSVASDCFKAGIHVLVEKPIARTVKEAEEMIRLAKQKGLVLQVGHIERFNPVFEQLEKILRSEKMIAIEARRLSPFIHRATDVSVVFDLMTHDLDLTLVLAKSEVKKIEAIGQKVFSKNLDHVICQLVFKNKLMANISASKVTHHRIRQLNLTCEDIFIETDLLQKTIAIHKQAISRYLPSEGQILYKQQESTETVFVPNVEPLHAEIRNFVDCVCGRSKPVVSAEEAFKVLQLATKIENISLNKPFTKGWLTLPMLE